MREMFSKQDDCYLLSNKLIKRLGNKIDFYGTRFIEIPSGKYLSSFRRNNGENMIFGNHLPFYFKFSENEFLRIQVGSNVYGSETGEKFAALSDFYEVLREEYGEPTLFYTTKNDSEELLSLQWSFINRKEEIDRFKDGTYFDDAEIDTLIIFNEKKNNDNKYILSDKTRELISRQVGLPYELLYLVDEDIENFVKHKTGKEMTIPIEAKVDGVPVTPFKRKLRQK